MESTIKVIEFYQEEAYVKLEARLLNGTPRTFTNKAQDIALPLVIREIPGTDYYDALSPYGYPGLIHDQASQEEFTTFWEEYNQFCKSEKIVSTFVRLNPIYNCTMFTEQEHLKHLVHGRVITVPLKKDYAELKSNYSSNHKRGIKKLLKNGFRVEKVGLSGIDDFIDLYNETMKRLDASDYYFFDKAYYTTLFNLTSDIELYLAYAPNGDVASGALFMISEDYIQYHLGGTNDAYVRDSPNKLIFDAVIQAHSGQKEFLILGGGLNNNEDSLFKFKEGFSKTSHKFSTLRMVHMKDQYMNLCKDAEMEKEEIQKLEGFFPLYRKLMS